MRALKKHLTTGQWIVTVLSALAILLLILGYFDRVSRFETSHRNLARTTSAEVANQVAFILTERQRQVQLYAEDHLPLLRQVQDTPGDTNLHKQLERSLKRVFPDVFGFTITDAQGQPLIPDFEGYVGDVCVQDIQAFALRGFYAARIHPNNMAYHYDVMANWRGTGERPFVLMVSFAPTELGQMIRSIQPPGHQLMLVSNAEQPMIEVTAEGARNRTPREDFHLTPDEQDRLLARHPVAHSLWQVADLAQPDLFAAYKRRTLGGTLILLLAFGLVIGASLFLLRREDRRRQAAERSREELLSVITHEMRTPISTISSTLSLLNHGQLGELPPRLQSGLSMIERNAERLLRLIDDLLESRRIESDGLSLHKGPVDLARNVQDTLAQLHDYAQQSDVRLDFTPPQEALWVHADPLRLQQIASNLISNATKFSPRGGTVRVGIMKSGPGKVRVCISDDGPGIAADFGPRVFEKFARGTARPNRPIASTGLGLSIVKALVEAHDGSVGFESVEGQGTTFHFELPSVPPPAPDTAAGGT